MQVSLFTRSISRIIFIAALIVSLVACKKDKNNNQPGSGNSGNKIATFTHGDEYIKFEYNADGTVKKLIVNTELNTYGYETEFTVVYDAQKRISKLESDWESLEVEYTNNVMSRAKLLEYGHMIGYTNYNYEGGNLKTATLYFGEAGVYVPTYEFHMNYNAQGNLNEIINMIATDENHMERTGSVTYQYDDKVNPLYEHRQLLALFWQPISKNNITVENHLDASNQPEDKYQYTYTYNSKGLPEKAVVKQGFPGEEQTNSEIKYTYK